MPDGISQKGANGNAGSKMLLEDSFFRKERLEALGRDFMLLLTGTLDEQLVEYLTGMTLCVFRITDTQSFH